MLINKKSYKCDHVKFISYDGKFPCLCSGTLILEINGTKHSFGLRKEFPRFWSSSDTGGEWIIDVDEIPEQFRQYAYEIDEIFNDNVTHGCCGGCY